jgi:hypothetical protein
MDGCSSRLHCLGSSVDGLRPLTHFTSRVPVCVWLMAQSLVSRRLRTAPMDAGRRTQTNLSNKLGVRKGSFSSGWLTAY